MVFFIFKLMFKLNLNCFVPRTNRLMRFLCHTFREEKMTEDEKLRFILRSPTWFSSGTTDMQLILPSDIQDSSKSFQDKRHVVFLCSWNLFSPPLVWFFNASTCVLDIIFVIFLQVLVMHLSFCGYYVKLLVFRGSQKQKPQHSFDKSQL